MSNKTKYNLLTLISCAAVFVAAMAMIIAYRLFGFRAALLTFAAECAAIAMSIAVYSQNELEDDDEEPDDEKPEQYETRKLKCAECGEIFEYHVAVDLPEEKKQEFQLLRRCPLCGGKLEGLQENCESEESDHV